MSIRCAALNVSSRACSISSREWAYWLVFPRERRMVPKVKRFREWLLHKMRVALDEIDGGWASQGRVPEMARQAAGC